MRDRTGRAEGVLRSFRLALRSLARSPGFTLTAVLTLGLGLGASAAVLTVIDAVVFAQLPYEDPERLVVVEGTRTTDGVERWPISYLDFRDWSEQAGDAFEAVAARTETRSFNLLSGDEVRRIAGEMVTASYFPLLGVEPALGRWFGPEEDRPPAGTRVAVVAHDLWQSELGGGADVLGRSLVLNGLTFTVVGVAPPGFRGLTDRADIWLPLATASAVETPPYLENRSFRWLSAVARLAPGTSRREAGEVLRTVTGRLEREHAATNRGIGARLVPLAEAWFGDLAKALWALLAGAACVLAVACVNVAALQLARETSRRREAALHAALGAGRGRLAGRVLAESAVIALGGALAGLLLAHWGTGVLLSFSAYDLRSFVDPAVGWTVAGVACGAAVVCALAFGAVPAVTVSRTNLAALLKAGGQGAAGHPGRARLRSALVVTEVALTLALFVGAALTVQGLRSLRERDLGFRTSDLLSARLDLKGEEWAEDPPVVQLARGLTEEVGALPGAESVALVGPGMPTDDWHGVEVTVESRLGTVGDGEKSYALRHHVTPGYFRTLGVPLLAGRAFSSADDADGELVLVVSRSMARQWWGSPEEAVGERIKFGPVEMEIPWFRVIGVVGDVEQRGLRGDPGPGPDLYFALLQAPPRSPAVINVLVRTAVPPEQLATPLRSTVRELAPGLVAYDVRPVADRLDEQVAEDRFAAVLLGVFAALALVLAAVGIGGLLAYVVGERRREIGLRMALGAGRGEVVRSVVVRGLVLVGTGLALGTVVSVVLSRWLQSRLRVIEPTDPLTLAAAALVITAVALVAAYLPARRAAGVDPMISLRSEEVR